MTSFAHSKLTDLQREVLDAFFQRERGFFLTGGAALAGFHLGHRTTDDLDLFTRHQLASSAVASSSSMSPPPSEANYRSGRMPRASSVWS